MPATIAYTFLKGGNIASPLEDAIKKLSTPMIHIPMGDPAVNKYGLFDNNNPHIIMISQRKDLMINPGGYNVLYSITSYSDIKNKNEAERFQSETGILLNIEPPEHLKKLF